MPRMIRLFGALALTCFLGGCGEHDPNYSPSESDVTDAIIAGQSEAGWKSAQSAMETQRSFQEMQTQIDAAMQNIPK